MSLNSLTPASEISIFTNFQEFPLLSNQLEKMWKMPALFQVTYSIQSISLLILAPNEKKNVVKSLLSHQLSLVSSTGPEEHLGTVGQWKFVRN